MIKSRRKLHLFAWIALAILLPVLVGVGIISRHAEPSNEEVPEVERNFSTNE